VASNSLINPTDIENISAVNAIDVEIISNELELVIPNYGCPTMFKLWTSFYCCIPVHLSNVWFLNYVINSSLLFISNFTSNIFGITCFFYARTEHPDSTAAVGFQKKKRLPYSPILQS
jgi:hypothetical protein